MDVANLQAGVFMRWDTKIPDTAVAVKLTPAEKGVENRRPECTLTKCVRAFLFFPCDVC
jgi:hypothetical protein